MTLRGPLHRCITLILAGTLFWNPLLSAAAQRAVDPQGTNVVLPEFEAPNGRGAAVTTRVCAIPLVEGANGAMLSLNDMPGPGAANTWLTGRDPVAGAIGGGWEKACWTISRG